jgi:chondroitin AC lyase
MQCYRGSAFLVQGMRLAASLMLVSMLAHPVYGGIAEDMALLKARIIEEQMDPAVDSNAVEKLRATLAADGTWPGINYASKGHTRWVLMPHLENLRSLARAYAKPGYALAGDAGLLADILRAYDAWIARDPKSTNWYYNDIFTPQRLGEIMLLIESQLSTSQKTAGINILKRAYRSRSHPVTGANRSDRSYASLMRGLLAADAALVSDSMRSIGDTIPITTGEGLQPDQTYHLHGNQLHIHGYGSVFLNSVPRFGRWAAGTAFAYDPLQVRVLVDFLLDGVQYYVRGDSVDFTAYGRGVSRAPQLNLATSFRAPLIDALALADGYREAELQAFSRRLEADVASASASPATALTGTRHFWRSDSTTHHRPDIAFFVKFSSPRALQPESGNNEGLRNLHLADGVTLLMRDGNEYDGIMPVWNWRNLPGTTTEQGRYSLKPRRDWGVAGTSKHAGAAATGSDAAVAFLYQNLNVTARKSWFLFDDRLIALGSGINGPQGGATVMTSVNDCLLRGPVHYSVDGTDSQSLDAATTLKPTSLRWVHHDGIGYYFPASGNPAGMRLSNTSRSGSWRDINRSQSADTVTLDVFALQIDHGVAPSGGSYAYIAAPVASASAMPDNQLFDIEILRHDDTVHAVRDPARGLIGANFWQQGEVAGITVNTQACVLVRQDAEHVEISLTDPTHASDGELVVELAVPVAGMLHADSRHVAVELLPGGVRLRVQRWALQGRTVHASFFLRPDAYRILEIPAEADAFAWDAHPDKSYGTGENLTTKLVSNSGHTRIVYLRFAVPPLSAPAAAASLRLHCTLAQEPGLHGLLPLDDSPWTENGLTWNNRPQPRAAPLALWIPAAGTSATINVTSSMPSDWASGGSAAFSIAPQTRTRDGLVNYASREHTDASLRPRLILAVPAGN